MSSNKKKTKSPPAWQQGAYRPPCGKYSLCCSVLGGGGTSVAARGYPSPSCGGVPHPWPGGTPVLSWGVPQSWTGWIPVLSWPGGYPCAGVPPDQGLGTPPPAPQRPGTRDLGKNLGLAYPPPWTDRHLWKQYLPHPSDADDNNLKWTKWWDN